MKYYFVSGGAEVEATLAVVMEAGVEVTEAGGGAGTETQKARLIIEEGDITTETEATTREVTTTDTTVKEVTRGRATTATCARS